MCLQIGDICIAKASLANGRLDGLDRNTWEDCIITRFGPTVCVCNTDFRPRPFILRLPPNFADAKEIACFS